jgi:arabinofuranan 3-O-arabinosyltransferase
VLTLPQSHNFGWTATVDGVDLGAPLLIDGYANGWLLPPGPSDRSLELRWTPQRSVNVGLGISVLAALAIFALIATGRVRRNRRHFDPAAADVDWSRDATTPAPAPAPATLTAATGITVVGFMFVGGPFAALAAGVLSLIVLVAHRNRLALVLAVTIVCVGWAAVSGLIIALEWRYDYANGPDWPLHFTWAAPITWMVVAAVSTQVLMSVLAPARVASEGLTSTGSTLGESTGTPPDAHPE